LNASAALRAKIGGAAAAHVAVAFSASEYASRVEDVYTTLWPEMRRKSLRPVERFGSDTQ
jgi:hypothetical protein